jgi:hypothetical protein
MMFPVPKAVSSASSIAHSLDCRHAIEHVRFADSLPLAAGFAAESELDFRSGSKRFSDLVKQLEAVEATIGPSSGECRIKQTAPSSPRWSDDVAQPT